MLQITSGTPSGLSRILEQLGGVVAVAAEVYDMRRASLQQEVHNLVHQQTKVGFALMAAIIGLTVRRWTVHMKPEYPVSAIYLDFAVLTMGLAAFQGWLGRRTGVLARGLGETCSIRRWVGREPQDAQSHLH